ncbi:hypothetical protein [Kribbella jiaozuonensis]|uniref:hypothetical protein n=1 Tax=Kribbella jiaozuonensis TaxID=2575441 RepID=UPI00360F8931
MTKLTDEELGDLLRETFADRETLVRQLPEATKRRHPGPILLAAAAVLAVLAGVLYGVHRADRPDPAPPVAAATEPGDIWGAAIVAIARQFAPAGGWQSIEVSGPGDRPWTLPSGATPPPVVKFTAEDRKRIEQVVAPVAPVVWNGRDSGNACDGRRVASISVGPIVDKGDHQEVAVSIFYDCGRGYLPTYRIERVDGVWKVTGTIGYPTGVEPLGGCPTPEKTSTSPRRAC